MVDSSVLYIAGVAVLVAAANYFMSKNEPAPRPARRRVPQEQIAAVAARAPTAPHDAIVAELERGGSVDQVVSRLENAQRSAKQSGSLLGHYNLKGTEQIPETSIGWKQSREEREAQLRANREAMVLRARNKLRDSA